MRTRLAAYLFGFNLDKIAYPWRESVASALELADGVYFCACDVETLESALDLAEHNPKLHILEHKWADEYFGSEDKHRYRIQSVIANYILGYIESANAYDYALKQDADEVLCEWSFDKFRSELDRMEANGVLLGRPRYLHFCPDDHTTFPFIYESKAVISRLGMRMRFNEIPDKGNADACALGGAPEFQTSLQVHHFGKMDMGRKAEALFKEHDFQRHYHFHGFPDPKVEAQMDSGVLDYLKVFDISLHRGEFKAYHGPQPKFVQAWLQEMRQREQEYRESH